jgi:hypothetical protein
MKPTAMTMDKRTKRAGAAFIPLNSIKDTFMETFSSALS